MLPVACAPAGPKSVCPDRANLLRFDWTARCPGHLLVNQQLHVLRGPRTAPPRKAGATGTALAVWWSWRCSVSGRLPTPCAHLARLDTGGGRCVGRRFDPPRLPLLFERTDALRTTARTDLGSHGAYRQRTAASALRCGGLRCLSLHMHAAVSTSSCMCTGPTNGSRVYIVCAAWEPMARRQSDRGHGRCGRVLRGPVSLGGADTTRPKWPFTTREGCCNSCASQLVLRLPCTVQSIR